MSLKSLSLHDLRAIDDPHIRVNDGRGSWCRRCDSWQAYTLPNRPEVCTICGIVKTTAVIDGEATVRTHGQLNAVALAAVRRWRKLPRNDWWKRHASAQLVDAQAGAKKLLLAFDEVGFRIGRVRRVLEQGWLGLADEGAWSSERIAHEKTRIPSDCREAHMVADLLLDLRREQERNAELTARLEQARAAAVAQGLYPQHTLTTEDEP